VRYDCSRLGVIETMVEPGGSSDISKGEVIANRLEIHL
jgi:hypothetical protein